MARPTERQLAVLWRGRRFPHGALVTRAGVPVTVVFQGRAGRGPGPDFRGAVISGPSGVPLRGDIELHVRSSSFAAHGHNTDPAYSGVILHVVWEDDTGCDTPLPGGAGAPGGAAPVVALAPWVAQRAGELERWLAQPLLWREPCHSAVQRMGVAAVAAAVEAEADRRLAIKTARISEVLRAAGLDQALYEGLMEALGYGGNASAMLALARHLPWPAVAQLVDARAATGGRGLALEATLLGGAGLLPSQRGHSGPVHPYVTQIEGAFAASAFVASGGRSLTPGLWKLWGVRPANFPSRRIAAAAALLTALGSPSALLASLEATTTRQAIAPLTSAVPSGYWLHHHDLCAGPSRMPAAYIGRGRAIEILLNVVLPAAAAAAAASGDEALGVRARSLFAKLPRPAAYGVTRYLEEAIAADGVRLPLNARRAQGLLALNRDWCTQGGCGRCPLS